MRVRARPTYTRAGRPRAAHPSGGPPCCSRPRKRCCASTGRSCTRPRHVRADQVLQAEDWSGEDNEGGLRGPHYFVHYLGWKKTWDEWVPQERVLKLCDENIAKQKALVDARRAESDAAPRDDGAARRDAKKGGRSSKRSREASEQDEDRRPELVLAVPDVLKAQLVDDWENVTRKEQLVPVPRTPSVRDILDEFGAQHSKHDEARTDVLGEVLAGLKLYFDRSLAQNLLYRFERQQYVDLRRQHTRKCAPGAPTPDIEPSAFYGAEHLLRLFGACPADSQSPEHRRTHKHGCTQRRDAA